MQYTRIVSDFTEFPGLRHCDISDDSGELFYHTVLNKVFAKTYSSKDRLTIDLDGTAGYASSFLDEAFGNLVFDYTLEVVKKIIEIKSDDEPHWKDMIIDQTYKQWEGRRVQNKSPKVTKLHEAWYRLVEGELVQKVWETPAAV